MTTPPQKTSDLHLQLPAPLPKPRTPRCNTIVAWFGLMFPADKIDAATTSDDKQLRAVLPADGQILLITGPSGAGKSSLLRSITRKTVRRDWINLTELRLPNRPLVDCFGTWPLEKVLAILSRVGLAEAWTYLRTPAELSDGQRWRFRLALAMQKAESRRRPVLVCDEFAALLDRVTAAVVARSLRRAISASHRPQLGAVLATSHDDLLGALSPDLHVRCDFGRAQVSRMANEAAATARSNPESRRQRPG